jgi:hypothetical protein
MNQLTVIEKFKKGVDKRYAGMSVFAQDGKLHSFGTHFTLAIRRGAGTNKKDNTDWILLNGDMYSRVTNRHQAVTFNVLKGYPRVAFSAIEAAGLRSDTCNVIDWTGDIYGICHEGDPGFETFRRDAPTGTTINEGSTNYQYVDGKYTPLDSPLKTLKYHRIGGVGSISYVLWMRDRILSACYHDPLPVWKMDLLL